jgi:hypothetical protein
MATGDDWKLRDCEEMSYVVHWYLDRVKVQLSNRVRTDLHSDELTVESHQMLMLLQADVANIIHDAHSHFEKYVDEAAVTQLHSMLFVPYQCMEGIGGRQSIVYEIDVQESSCAEVSSDESEVCCLQWLIPSLSKDDYEQATEEMKVEVQ